jgi:hypothetical protein
MNSKLKDKSGKYVGGVSTPNEFKVKSDKFHENERKPYAVNRRNQYVSF